MKLQVTGFDALENYFTAGAAALQDDTAVREIAIEAAMPIRDAAEANIAKATGRTSEQITIDDVDSAPGVVKVAVGIPSAGAIGRGSRAYIGRFLEFGTRKKAARPWMRPAYDGAGGAAGVAQRIAAGLRSLLSRGGA